MPCINVGPILFLSLIQLPLKFPKSQSMKVILIFITLPWFCLAITNFRQWKLKNHKTYKGRREKHAEMIFKENIIAIEKHNKLRNFTYTMDDNDAADMSDKERNLRRGSKPQPDSVHGSDFLPMVRGSLPRTINYARFMPAVRNQGKCGSCWAFSVVSALEYWNAKRGKRLQFSEQDLVDCNTRNKACNGGNPYFAFEYIKHSGISDGRRYKYAERRQSCRKSQFPSILQIKRFCTGTLNGDENALKSVVANYGPVVVLIRTSNTDFDFYKRGIYDDPRCGSDKRLVDHAVTLVGYGTDSRYGDYWLIRNSWGTSWGENGYMRMVRGKNMCGIAHFVYAPC